MPQRFANLFVALVGAITVLGIVLIGLDVRRSARTGPRWKRRLITAGVMLLAVLGWWRVVAEPSGSFGVVTCYEPLPMPFEEMSVGRLQNQLPILEKMLTEEKLDSTVVAKTLQTVEADLAILDDEAGLKGLNEKKRKEAVELRDSVREMIEKIRLKIEPQEKELTETEEWKAIIKAWAAATPLAESGESTEAQRKSVDEQIAKAVEAAKALVEKNALTEAEAGLLESEATRLTSEIRRNPPTDCQIMCYDMAYLPPVRSSLTRINARLPLLKKLAQGGDLHRSVLEKILPSLETDLAILSDEKELAGLADGERAEAIKSRDAAKANLDAIRKALGEEK